MKVEEVARSVDPKKALRIAWIVESGIYVVCAFVVIFFLPDKIEGLTDVSPYILGVITIQGGAAWTGSSIKRLTEAAKIRAKDGEKDVT